MSSRFTIENGHVEVLTVYKLVPKQNPSVNPQKPILVEKATFEAILSGIQYLTRNLAIFDFVQPFKRRELEIRLFDDNRQFVLTRQEGNHIILEEYTLSNIRWIKNSEIEFDGGRDYIDQLISFVGYTGSDETEDGFHHEQR